MKSGKTPSLLRRHPWIFSGAIKSIEGNVTEGSLVKVFDNKGEFLAIGHYQVGSIAIRIISFEDKIIDYDFWKNKISTAYQLRNSLELTDNSETNAFRLVNAEGDELPGLVIDFYNGVAVTQFHSIGLYLVKDLIVQALKDVLKNKLEAVYDKSEGTMPFKAAIKPSDGFLFGHSDKHEILEYGNQFKIDWASGQKTGFFIDQRENRKLLQQYSKNRNVLNLFCYTGGFSVYALRGGARLVHSVDSSSPAIGLANENIAMNFPGTIKHAAFNEDVFEFLNKTDEKYDLIIIDPPAFAKHNNALHNALQAYKRLNQKVMEKIQKGGILFTFSCSQVVSKDDFRKSVFAAAVNAHRKVKILHQLTQPPDHCVSIFHPEGEYLKGLVLYVE